VEWATDPPFGLDDLEPDAAGRYRLCAPDALKRRDALRCCANGCLSWLPPIPRAVRGRVYCEQHGIGMSNKPTYVYHDFRRNFIVGRELLAPGILTKVERWRLVNEGSEDAVSWNAFVSLARLNALASVFHLLTGRRPGAEPELYLWGNRIGAGMPEFWVRLGATRAELESDLSIQTEPDVILRVPGEAIVLIEAKFGSGNGTLAGKAKQERFGTVGKFLDRYRSRNCAPDPLNRGWIANQCRAGILEQLCRNVVFAHWLAGPDEEAWVINLVREAKDAEARVGPAMKDHLAGDTVRFRRATWEDLYRGLPVIRTPEGAPLRRYLENKTLDLRRAFLLNN
jgi:hypothetical protein